MWTYIWRGGAYIRISLAGWGGGGGAIGIYWF